MPSKTLSTVATEIIPSNSARKSLFIQNEDTQQVIYVKKERSESTSVSATDHDYRLGPGAAMAINNLTDGTEAIQARYTGIADGATPRIAFTESEDIRR